MPLLPQNPKTPWWGFERVKKRRFIDTVSPFVCENYRKLDRGIAVSVIRSFYHSLRWMNEETRSLKWSGTLIQFPVYHLILRELMTLFITHNHVKGQTMLVSFESHGSVFNILCGLMPTGPYVFTLGPRVDSICLSGKILPLWIDEVFCFSQLLILELFVVWYG